MRSDGALGAGWGVLLAFPHFSALARHLAPAERQPRSGEDRRALANAASSHGCTGLPARALHRSWRRVGRCTPRQPDPPPPGVTAGGARLEAGVPPVAEPAPPLAPIPFWPLMSPLQPLQLFWPLLRALVIVVEFDHSQIASPVAGALSNLSRIFGFF